MKSTFFVLFLFCATASFGQAVAGISTMNADPQVTQFYTHPQHAMQQSLASEQSLLNRSSYVYAQGERPLWEMMPPPVVTPLGDTARALRKEHASARKAKKYWEN